MRESIFCIAKAVVATAPELRETKKGNKVCNFNVVTNKRWQDAEGNSHERQTWLRVVAWDEEAERICNSKLTVGSLVEVRGELQSREFKTKEGEDRSSIELRANEVDIIRFKKPEDK